MIEPYKTSIEYHKTSIEYHKSSIEYYKSLIASCQAVIETIETLRTFRLKNKMIGIDKIQANEAITNFND